MNWYPLLSTVWHTNGSQSTAQRGGQRVVENDKRVRGPVHYNAGNQSVHQEVRTMPSCVPCGAELEPARPRSPYRLCEEPVPHCGDRRQLVLPVATTIFAGRDGVIIRYGGTVDYRPTNQAIEAETYGRQDTGNGSGQGWDERAFSAQVAERAIAVAGETGASVAHSARPLRRGVGG